MKMVTGVMWFTPVGVSSVIAGKILGVSNVGKFNLILMLEQFLKA